MNTKRIFGLVAALTGLLLTACGAAATPMPPGAYKEVAPANAPVAEKASSGTTTAGGDKAVNDVVGQMPHMVIRNATLTLVVRDTQAQISTIMRMADELKGFVASSSTTKDGSDLQAQIVLRVPADRLDEALDRARKLAVEVRQEQVTGDDVTAEYVDLTSRVKNLEAAEEQLRAILAKADKTDDVLNVFKELTNVRGEIEQARGRMQFLSQSAAMATITLSLLPDKPAQPLQAPGWRPEGVAKAALEKLIAELQNLADVVIYLAIFVLPIVTVTMVAPIVLVFALLRRRSRRKTAAA